MIASGTTFSGRSASPRLDLPDKFNAALGVSYPLVAEHEGRRKAAAGGAHPNQGIAAQYQHRLAALIDAMHAETPAIINLSAASPHSPGACSRPTFTAGR